MNFKELNNHTKELLQASVELMRCHLEARISLAQANGLSVTAEYHINRMAKCMDVIKQLKEDSQ